MIITCKLCRGTGQYGDPNSLQTFFEGTKPCPVCKGAGELVLPGLAENYVVCKICKGSGSVQSGLLEMDVSPCPSCKGAGSLARPIIHSPGQTIQEINYSSPPRPRTFEWDVALSFAGEDRAIAEQYAEKIKSKGLRTFLDSDEQAALWGADLYVKLDEIYRSKAMFCVLFVSRSYAAKHWTNHERQSAQARAFKENRAYILPVRLDNTEIPGLRETVGYIDLRKSTLDDLAELTIKKVQQDSRKV